MKRFRVKNSKGRRRGSALVTVVILAALVLFSVASLSSYAMYRRMSAVRMMLYSSELAAAENALERSYSLLFFASQRRPAQIRLGNGVEGFVEEVVALAENIEGYDIEVLAIPLRDDAGDEINGIVTIDARQVDILGTELSQWMDYSMQVSGWQVMAGARARNVRDTEGNSAFPFQNFLSRPGAYAGKNLVQYSVPLLNYAIFYENTFELDAGERIDVRGKVHTNSDWFLTTSSSAYYHDYATVAGNLYGGVYHYGDHGRRSWSGSQNVYLAHQKLTSGQDPTRKLHNSARTVNNGWLSSVLYNNASGGKPGAYGGWTSNPAWFDESNATFNGYLKDSQHGVREVQLPIDEQDSPRLLIEAPLPPSGQYANPADMSNDGKMNVNLAYKAGLIIETSPGFVAARPNEWLNYVEAYRWVDGGLDENGVPIKIKEPISLTYERIKPGSNPPVKEIVPMVERVTIYNGREEKNVTLVDFKVDRYAEFLKLGETAIPDANAEAGQGMPLPLGPDPQEAGIVYFNVSQDGLSSNQQAGVRLNQATFLNLSTINAYSQRADGKEGLAFGTNAPMYTLGHLNHDPSNASNRIPLMIAGDAINILSSAFKDSDYATGSGNGPNKAAKPTTTNAVFVSGNVPSRSGQYSGGGENFYRYLETWGSGNPHTFTGSMLNLYESQIALGAWDKDSGTGTSSGYYGPPRRIWGWDTRFSDAGNAPPGIPTSFNVSKGRWQIVDPGTFQDAGGSEDLALNPHRQD